VRLFLSYGRRDAAELADRLRADLEARGYEVWQDTRQIRSGREWELEIEDGLRNAQLLVALLSPHAVRRAGGPHSPDDLDSVCLDEISFARFRRPPKPIVPVLAAPCEPPFSIFRLDYVDLCAWRDSEDKYRAGLQRLLEAVEAALRGETRYRPWELQLRPWDFAAFLDEKRRHFCGRQWLFEAIDAWRASHQEPALLITGDPGVGKSALVAELVHRNPGGQVLAYHCCQADTPATLDPGRFVRSLAAMMASRLEGYARLLSETSVREALSESGCAHEPASAFEAGVLAPLRRLPAPGEGGRYLLVDALDEALALREGAWGLTIVDVLAARLNRFPPWLRVVATTRKDRNILARLRGLRAHELDAQDPRNLQDIEDYLSVRLASPQLAEELVPSRRSAREVAVTLRTKSAGNFLYAQQVLEGIERHQYRLDRLDALPPGLYGLYLRSFERHFPDERRYAAARSVLQVVVAAREPLAEEQLARATGLDLEGELPHALRNLAPYLPRREGRYAVYHKSLADWLTDDELRGTCYYVSRRRGHELLADLCWGEYRRGARALSAYALAHLPSHLLGARRWGDLAHVLCDLPFLEAKAEAGLVFNLADDFTEAVRQLPPEAPGRRLLGLLEEALRADIHFLARHPACLFQCLWNRCWWYDSPQGESHFDPPASGWPSGGPPWAGPEPRLHRLLESWRAAKKQAVPGFRWVRSLHPPADPLGAAQRAVLRGHQGGVTCVAITRDGRHIASGASDRTVRVWHAQSGSEMACLRGHERPVDCVAFSPDGGSLASGSWDWTVRLWDVPTGTQVACLRGHEQKVNGVAFAPDGRHVVSGAWDGTVRIWDVDAGRQLACLCLCGHTDRVLTVALSPDGSRVASGSSDQTIRLWDPARQEEIACLRGHGDEVRAVAFSADGRYLASGSADRTIRLWDAQAGSELACFACPRKVNSVAFSPDGKRLVWGSTDGTVRVRAAESGAELACFRGHERAVRSVVISPDGQHVISAGDDEAVRVWNAQARGELSRPRGHEDWVSAVAFSPNGTHLLSWGDDRTIRLWDPEGGGQRACFRWPNDLVWGITFSPDSSRVVFASEDDTVCVWDLKSDSARACFRGNTGWRWTMLTFSPDGRRLAAGSDDKTARVWDLESGNELICLRGHYYTVRCLTFSADGRQIATGSSDKAVRIWDAGTGRELACLRGHGGAVRVVAFSPDGRRIASGSDDRAVLVWDAVSGREVADLRGHDGAVDRVSFSPDGQRVVSRSADRTVRIWDVAGAACIDVIDGIGDDVAIAAGPPQFPWVAAARKLETVIQDATTGEALAWFPAALRHLSTHPSGRIWAGAAGHHLYLFTLEEG
jgi:WD40 repeat protein